MAEVYNLNYKKEFAEKFPRELIKNKIRQAIIEENIIDFGTWIYRKIETDKIELNIYKIRKIIHLDDQINQSFFQRVWVGVKSSFKETSLSEMAVRINRCIYPHFVRYRDEIIDQSCDALMVQVLDWLNKKSDVLVYPHAEKENVFVIELKKESSESLF